MLHLALDGKQLASGDYDGTIKIWDTKSGRELFRLCTGIQVVCIEVATLRLARMANN